MDLLDSSPPAKKIKLISSARDINGLSDADLSEIFIRLPPYDRLRTSEVCKRWHTIGRNAWLDIIYLDLSPIPGPSIAAIIKQCPNLRTVFAMQKVFRPSELSALARVDLQSLTLQDCKVVGVPVTPANYADPLTAVFSGFVRSANWQEFVLDGLVVEFEHLIEDKNAVHVVFAASLPSSLRRLQLTSVSSPPINGYPTIVLCTERLRALECLMLSCTRLWYRLENIGPLRNLRELLVGGSHTGHVRPLLSLAMLDTLFLHDFSFLSQTADFVTLVTKHTALRILVFTGFVGTNTEFPARVRYANGFSADPLPQLHVVVGKNASACIRFPKFASDAAKVYPISEPLPQFLEREDIKPIFEGVWIAAQIKEAAKQGSVWYNYASDVATSFHSSDT